MNNFIKLTHSIKKGGIYYNSNIETDLDLSKSSINLFRQMSYKFMNKFSQSIHHINFMRGKNGNLTGIYFGMRQNTIKPEYIDVEYLEGLKKSFPENFSEFEESLLVIGKHNQNNLSEVKTK